MSQEASEDDAKEPVDHRSPEALKREQERLKNRERQELALTRGRRRLSRCPDLVTHLDIAAQFGVNASTWRHWLARGEVPLPHSTIGRFLFYDVSLVVERLRTGLWPRRAKFSISDPYPDEPFYPPIHDPEDPALIPKEPLPDKTGKRPRRPLPTPEAPKAAEEKPKIAKPAKPAPETPPPAQPRPKPGPSRFDLNVLREDLERKKKKSKGEEG